MRTIRLAPTSPGNRLGALLLVGGLCVMNPPVQADPLAGDMLERPPTVKGGGPEDDAAAPMQFASPESAFPSSTGPAKAFAPAVRGDAAGYGGTEEDGTGAALVDPGLLADEDEEGDDAPWTLSAFGGRARPGGCINGALHISVCGPDLQAWQQSAEFALKDVWRRIAGKAPTIRTAFRNAPVKARPAQTRDGWRLRVNRRVLMLNWQVRF